MLIRFVRLAERITGALLGSLAVSILAGNALVCLVVIIMWGRAPIDSSSVYL